MLCSQESYRQEARFQKELNRIGPDKRATLWYEWYLALNPPQVLEF